MFDVSVTHASELVAAAFEYSHLVFASITYNAGVFTPMESLLRELVAHNLQNRVVAVMESGSWAVLSGKQMKELLLNLKNTVLLEESVSMKSSVKQEQMEEIECLVEALAARMNRILK